MVNTVLNATVAVKMKLWKYKLKNKNLSRWLSIYGWNNLAAIKTIHTVYEQ